MNYSNIWIVNYDGSNRPITTGTVNRSTWLNDGKSFFLNPMIRQQSCICRPEKTTSNFDNCTIDISNLRWSDDKRIIFLSFVEEKKKN